MDVEVVVVVVVLVPFVLLVPSELLLGQICVVVQMGNGFWTIHG